MTSRALSALVLLAACGGGEDPAPSQGEPASGVEASSASTWRLAARSE